jgi:cytochrome c5
MKYAAIILIAASAASLLACGKSEDAPAPSAPPAAETPQTGAAPEPLAPLVETPQSEAPATLPETKLVEPAAVSPPVAAKPEPAARVASKTAPDTPPPDPAHGQQIYRQACAFCHDKGVAGAPKIGDVAAWSPRLAQGLDTLYTVALRGKGAMPARGGNPALADADVRAAVDHLVAQAR